MPAQPTASAAAHHPAPDAPTTRPADLFGRVRFGTHNRYTTNPLVHVVDQEMTDAPRSLCCLTLLDDVHDSRPPGKLCPSCATGVIKRLFPEQREPSAG